jgi:hypothetical protein
MSQLAHSVRRSPRRVRFAVGALLLTLAVFAVFWIGRASADEGGASPAATIAKTFSNIATGRADAVEANDSPCTVSPQFNDMPGMSETFSFGGTASRPVLVLFQAEWFSFTQSVAIRLTIDGVVQSGAAIVVIDERESGAPDEVETHGYNFISDPLAPGTHTARIQWADSGAGPGCTNDRSLIVLHK